jgi:hypothetical protein
MPFSTNADSTHRGGLLCIETRPPKLPNTFCISGDSTFRGLPARSYPSLLILCAFLSNRLPGVPLTNTSWSLCNLNTDGELLRSVHPHVHGDNLLLSNAICHLYGLPPCAWGQRCWVPKSRFRIGSPPCAWGQRNSRYEKPSRETVHPHVHGDNGGWRGRRGGLRGSPPCAWGQRRMARTARRSTRFTPMCMGTTCIKTAHLLPLSVHPHVHGDNAIRLATVRIASGSPPCAWGQRGRCLVDEFALTVHPHVHGDNGSTSSQGSDAAGSPPCAWGQRMVR